MALGDSAVMLLQYLFHMRKPNDKMLYTFMSSSTRTYRMCMPVCICNPTYWPAYTRVLLCFNAAFVRDDGATLGVNRRMFIVHALRLIWYQQSINVGRDAIATKSRTTPAYYKCQPFYLYNDDRCIIHYTANHKSFNGKLFNHGTLKVHDKRLRADERGVKSHLDPPAYVMNVLLPCVNTHPLTAPVKMRMIFFIFLFPVWSSAAIECHRCSYVSCSGAMTWHVMFSAWFNIITNSSVGVFSHVPPRLSCEWTRCFLCWPYRFLVLRNSPLADEYLYFNNSKGVYIELMAVVTTTSWIFAMSSITTSFLVCRTPANIHKYTYTPGTEWMVC